MKRKWAPESEIALKAAITGAEILEDRDNDSTILGQKESNRDIVTNMDIEIERRIRGVLSTTRHRVIGEETATGDRINPRGYSWYVDPIDGTANFVATIPYYAVSVGLASGAGFAVGAVVIPPLKEMFFTTGDENSYLNGRVLKAGSAPLKESLVAAAFSGSSGNKEQRLLEYETFGKLNDGSRGCLRLGAASINICYVAAGRLQAAYGIANKIWDVAGAIAIASRAGCEVYTEWTPGATRISYVVGARGVAGAIAGVLRDATLARVTILGK